MQKQLETQRLPTTPGNVDGEDRQSAERYRLAVARESKSSDLALAVRCPQTSTMLRSQVSRLPVSSDLAHHQRTDGMDLKSVGSTSCGCAICSSGDITD